MVYVLDGSICFAAGFLVAWAWKGVLTAKLQAELSALKASAINAVNKLP